MTDRKEEVGTAGADIDEGVPEEHSFYEIVASEYEERLGERESVRKRWGNIILCLFVLSNLATLGLVYWAFYIDFNSAGHDAGADRIITTEVVLRLINASVIQVGATAVGIVVWAFSGLKGLTFFRREDD